MPHSPTNIAEHNKIVCKAPVAQLCVSGEKNNFGKPMMSQISRTTAAKWAPTQNMTDPSKRRQTCNV